MLIRPKLLRRYWGLRPATVVHVGGHHGEELVEYESAGWGAVSVIWVEALPSQVMFLRDLVANRSNHVVIEALAWDKSGAELDFFEASNTQASSALKFGTHKNHYPDIHETRVVKMVSHTLEELLEESPLGEIGLLNLDVQGAELRVLRGLGPKIREVRAIYTEVNVEEVYQGCAVLNQLDGWLQTEGFVRVDMVLTEEGWGDGLWIQKNRVPFLPGVRRMARLLHSWVGKMRRRLSKFR